jgi:hypothetical protein
MWSGYMKINMIAQLWFIHNLLCYLIICEMNVIIYVCLFIKIWQFWQLIDIKLIYKLDEQLQLYLKMICFYYIFFQDFFMVNIF